ncbi:DUF6482 family protein [Pseudomonas sp.]|uniref:DUF6482 family protein n=1 Tax=Pseudomonas sp. TaxID=306 RepID=UPI0028ACA71F|nr:DUF6482 family protein [Pseudomonas sp.]
MKVAELTKHVKDGDVKEIHFVSMEGGSFVIHALMNNVSHPVVNDHGETLHIASVEEGRKTLVNLKGDVQLFLVQPAVYEEMVGQDSTPQASKEPIPLHGNSMGQRNN